MMQQWSKSTVKRGRWTKTVAAIMCATTLTGCGGTGDHQGGGGQSGEISAAEIDAHIQFLSSDLLEGRAPATRGGELTELYLASRLKSYGLEPGFEGSYFQPVPIDVITPLPATISIVASGKASGRLAVPDDATIWAGSATTRSAANGEVVFVGYGADAPEYNWDDFKDADVKGKILLILVNDPPAPESNPELFGGKAMTYYGRWTYKFEEAERRGAAGAFVIHQTEDAGYPWQVVSGSSFTDEITLKRPDDAPPPLGVKGWIQHESAAKLLKQAGLDLDQLKQDAASPDFKPVFTGININMSINNTVREVMSHNVIGVIPGSDPELRDQYVIYSGHWDHLGIGPAVDGDSIYNGAEDNASGLADLLAIARHAAQSPNKPKRSQMFLFVTAEESGLLGSDYYAKNPTVPLKNIVAALNVDGGNLWGPSKDLRVIGEDRTSIGPMLAEMIKPDGMVLTPDPHPERGYFYRSDHFSFAKVGVPSAYIGAGDSYENMSDEEAKRLRDEYGEKHYHQPSDEYSPDWDLSGAVQLSNIVYNLALKIANANDIPTWNDGTEFKAIREKSLSE